MNPSETNFFARFLGDFYAECDEHLESIRHNIVELDRRSGDKAAEKPLVGDLFRSFHTLKGLAGMAGLQPMEKLAHQMESYLRPIQDGRARVAKRGMDALVFGANTLEQVLSAHRAGGALPDVDGACARFEPLARVESATPAGPAAGASADATITLNPEETSRLSDALAGGRAWKLEFTPSAELSARAINVNSIRERIKSAGELISASPRVSASGAISFQFLAVFPGPVDFLAAWAADGVAAVPYEVAEAAAEKETRAPLLQPSNVVRVDLSRLDDLMRLLGDLVITRSQLNSLADEIQPLVPPRLGRALEDVTQNLERQVKDLRNGVMRVRMVPIGEAFARMEFVVRDLLRDDARRVRLAISGQETEIDKFVVERLTEPLLHLVRNAVSHGFETPEQRLAAGKPEAGTLSLRASTNGDRVVVEIEDDGRGMEFEAVMERARKAGVDIPGGESPEAVLLAVICAPGFSTREAADRSSGRGVGMDVVRNVIEELGGTLSLRTSAGKGTRFMIGLPLTLSIVDALLVTAAGKTFALPLSSVAEITEVVPADVSRMENNEIVQYREGVLRLLRLSNFIGHDDAPRGRQYAVVLNGAAAPVALVVDRLMGQREVVVHALEDPLSRVPGVGGATQLGDGQVVLILDGPRLAARLMN